MMKATNRSRGRALRAGSGGRLAGGWAFAALACLVIGAGCNDSNGPEAASVSSNLNQSFVGSEKCQTCHEATYRAWKDSNHTKKFLPAVKANILADTDGDGLTDFEEVTSTDGVLLGSATNGLNDDDWASFGADAPHLLYDSARGVYQTKIGQVTYDIANVIGASGKWKQRYTTEVAVGQKAVNYILPLQYNVKTNRWTTYHSGDWYDGTTPKTLPTHTLTWEAKCVGCHATGVTDVTLDTTTVAADGRKNNFVATFSERNIGCEACHGAGGKHVSLGGGRGTITNPKDLSEDRGNEACGRCHSRGDSVYVESFDDDGKSVTFKHGYPRAADGTFPESGDTLSDFYTFKPRPGSVFWDDASYSSKSHHQQWLDIKETPHTQAGLTCWSCHDPHGSGFEGDLKDDGNAVCLSCHDKQGDIDADNLTAHTRHATSNRDANRCSTCHLPFMAKSAEKYDIRSHTFRVVFPLETVKLAGLPNSCQTSACHQSNTLDELQAFQKARWPENLRPVAAADANEDTQSPSGPGVWVLDGGRSFDPNGDPLTYEWTFVEGPDQGGSTRHQIDAKYLVASHSQKARLIAPLPGRYTLALKVTDEKGLSSYPATISFFADTAATLADVTSTQFTGSGTSTLAVGTCASCHQAQYDAWSQTAHTRKIRPATMDTVICDGNENGVNDFMDGTFADPVVLGFDTTAANNYPTANNPQTNYNSAHWRDHADDGTATSTNSADVAPRLYYDSGEFHVKLGPGVSDPDIIVTHVLGGNAKWKQRYITTLKVTEDGGTTTRDVRIILPLQYNSVDHNWESYHPERWYADANTLQAVFPSTSWTGLGSTKTTTSWNRDCIGCHATGVTEVRQATPTATYVSAPTWVTAGSSPATAQWVYTRTEDNIGCEACHGPGDQHAASPVLSTGGITNPRNLGTERANETCGRCHVRGKSRSGFAHGYPRNASEAFPKPGDVLEEFYAIDKGAVWQNANASEKQHHQQWMGFRTSKHHAAGLTCFECHDPHLPLPNGQLKGDANALCLKCHPQIVADAQAATGNHSKHPTGSEGNRCATCHMPPTASSAHRANDDSSKGFKENAYEIRTHDVRPVFPMDANGLNGMPNSCSTWGCHSKTAPEPFVAGGTMAGVTDGYRSKTDADNDGVYDWIEAATQAVTTLWGDLKPYASARFEDGTADPKPVKLARVALSAGTVDVQLDGLASYDPNGAKIASYAWTVTKEPNPGETTLSSTSAGRPVATIKTAGTYTFTLVVRDDKQESEPDSVTFVVE